MKFTIERSAALAAMVRVAAVIPDKHTIPILTNVHIEAFADGVMVFKGTNLEIFVTTTAECLVSEPGAITVPADMLNQIFRRSAEGSDLSFETGDAPARLHVRCGRSKWALPTLPASDYTAFPDLEWGATFDISASSLIDLLERPRFAAKPPSEKHLLHLAGVYLTVHGDEMHAVTMNGRAIGFLRTERPAGWLEDFGVILPHTLMDAFVATIAPERSRDIRLNVSANAASVIAGRTIVTGNAARGPFMDYIKIIDRYLPTATERVTVGVEALKASVLRAVAICPPKDRMVKLTLEDQHITISARGESAEGGDQVNCALEGQKATLGLMVDHLTQALDALGGDVVVVNYPMDGEGINLTTPDDPSARFFLGQCRV